MALIWFQERKSNPGWWIKIQQDHTITKKKILFSMRSNLTDIFIFYKGLKLRLINNNRIITLSSNKLIQTLFCLTYNIIGTYKTIK